MRKCPYDHWLINKAYLSVITVNNISKSSYLQDGGKNQLAQIWNKITPLSPYVYIGLTITRGMSDHGIVLIFHRFYNSFSTIRYEMRCLFNVRLEADMGQLNLPHGTKNYRKWKKNKLKSKNGHGQKYRWTVREIREVSPCLVGGVAQW